MAPAADAPRPAARRRRRRLAASGLSSRLPWYRPFSSASSRATPRRMRPFGSHRFMRAAYSCKWAVSSGTRAGSFSSTKRHSRSLTHSSSPCRRRSILDAASTRSSVSSEVAFQGVLGDVTGRPALQRPDRHVLAALRGHENHRHERVAVADRLHQLQPVHPRHVQVGDDGGALPPGPALSAPLGRCRRTTPGSPGVVPPAGRRSAAPRPNRPPPASSSPTHLRGLVLVSFSPVGRQHRSRHRIALLVLEPAGDAGRENARAEAWAAAAGSLYVPAALHGEQ